MLTLYFFPEKKYTMKTISRVTAKKRGLWTWPMAGLLWLHKKGLEIRVIELFDYKKFIDHKEEYLRTVFGNDVGNEQIIHSDIRQEVAFAQQLITTIRIQRKKPQIADIKALLDEGFLLICNVNSKFLHNEDGYVGHFLVIKGYDETHLFIHDPGLPPLEDQHISFRQFKKAWAYPDEKANNIMAFRKMGA